MLCYDPVMWIQIEIEYTHRAGSELKMEDKPQAIPQHAGNGDAEQKQDTPAEEEGEDFDIDDI